MTIMKRTGGFHEFVEAENQELWRERHPLLSGASLTALTARFAFLAICLMTPSSRYVHHPDEARQSDEAKIRLEHVASQFRN